MSNNIVEIFNDYKTKVEKEQFLVRQYEAITSLALKNQQLTEEVEHLKKLLVDAYPLSSGIEKVILTPEEVLIENQILILQNRSLTSEMTLEEVKKLDLLIKNKKLMQEKSKTVKGEFKKLDKKNFTNAELVLLASSNDESS